MAERNRRARRQVSEVTEESPDVSDADSEEFDLSSRRVRLGRQELSLSPASRSKRAANTSTQSASSTDGRQSIKLTMKVAPSKLREVMRANEVDALKDTLGGGTVLDGPRSRRSAVQSRGASGRASRLTYVEPREGDIEDDEEREEEDDDDTPAHEDVTMNDFDEVGAEAEGGTDDDEDEEMEDDSPPAQLPKKHQMPPKPPKIKLRTPAKGSKQSKPEIVVTPANIGPVRSVEDEEMDDDADEEDDDDDDEDDDDEEDDEEGSEMPDADETALNDETELAEEDAEGDDEELDEDDNSDLDDSDDEEPASGTATPDPSKMTSRQRGRPGEELMSLDMAPQQRKFFTEEEKAMKKDEHARKRKELTKRKTQEEKTAALNRLLKPQVSKSRGAAPKAETLAAQMQAAAEEVEAEPKADPLYVRWISSKDGVRLGVPEEWIGKNVGRYFGPPLSVSNGALVQELE